MALDFESTYVKAKREDEGYRRTLNSIDTWGKKIRLLPAAPHLWSLLYEGGLDTLIVNFHGGGFCYKHPIDDDALCQYISKTYCVTVLNIDFSSSVSWSYPVQLTEIERQLNAFLSERDFKKIILLGHSSGANLAVSLFTRWMKDGKHKTSALVLNNPFLDLSKDASLRPMAEGLWPDELLNEWISFYAPNKISRKDPSISPLYLNKPVLKKFPSTYIASCSEDRLNEDAIKFAESLKANRIDVRIIEMPERHGFIERSMKDVYRLPNDPSVVSAKKIVDQEIVFALTAK